MSYMPGDLQQYGDYTPVADAPPDTPPPAPSAPPVTVQPQAAPTSPAAPDASNVATAPVFTNMRVPTGGQLLSVNGVLVVVYDMGDGTKVYYDFSAPGTDQQVNLSAYPPAAAVDPNSFYATPGLVHAGMVQELFAPEIQQASSFQDWANNKLTQYSGGAAWSNDPEMRRIYFDWIVNPQKSADEIQAAIRQTGYWKSRTDAQRSYDNLSPADQAVANQNAAADIADRFMSVVGVPAGGQPMSVTDPQVQNWAQQVASGKTSLSNIIEMYLKPMALSNPESPWSRTVRQEELASRSRPIDLANKGGDVKSQFENWGIQTTPDTINQWAQQITDRQKSDADLTNYLQTSAKTIYPWKDPTVETKTAAEPWMATYARVLEKPAAGLYDPDVQKALQQGTPLWQFEQDLKKKNDWLYTNNAKQSLSDAASQVGQLMGFA